MYVWLKLLYAIESFGFANSMTYGYTYMFSYPLSLVEPPKEPGYKATTERCPKTCIIQCELV